MDADDTVKRRQALRVNRHEGITLAVIGKKSLKEGVRLTAAHLDAPRVDIRTVPLYEDGGMAFFKTHYYGGIKSTSGPPFRSSCAAWCAFATTGK